MKAAMKPMKVPMGHGNRLVPFLLAALWLKVHCILSPVCNRVGLT
jgi:hypothetical protein